MCYSIHPRQRISLKYYGFLSFAKNMAENIGKNISKNLNGKCTQIPLDHPKQPGTDCFKKSNSKPAETTDYLIGNKIAARSRKFQKIHNKIIQRQLQMRTMDKYLKKQLKTDIFVQKKDKKLQII